MGGGWKNKKMNLKSKEKKKEEEMIKEEEKNNINHQSIQLKDMGNNFFMRVEKNIFNFKNADFSRKKNTAFVMDVTSKNLTLYRYHR